MQMKPADDPDFDAKMLWGSLRIYAPNLDGISTGNGLQDGLPWDRLSEAEKDKVMADPLTPERIDKLLRWLQSPAHAKDGGHWEAGKAIQQLRDELAASQQQNQADLDNSEMFEKAMHKAQAERDRAVKVLKDVKQSLDAMADEGIVAEGSYSNVREDVKG